MSDSEAKVPAEDGLKVTITIAEKAGGSIASSTGSVVAAIESNTFTIENGTKILTITIAE